MKYIIYGAIGLFVLYTMLQPTMVDLVIDNPSSQPITVSVDELTVEVPANEVVWVEMGKGERTIRLENASERVFDFQDKAYFLNPTETSYLINEHVYGDLMAQLSYMQAFPDQKVEYLGMELEGRYSVVKGLINPITWDVGAREGMPETIQADEDEDYVVLKKLMDPNEFKTMLMEQLEAEAAEAAGTEEPG